MNLDSKLTRWLEAGIIDADTRKRIQAFEHGKERPVALYALGGLGALTIAVGLVSIVAANWAEIGDTTKLGIDLLLGAVLAAALYMAAARGKVWQTDLMAGIYYGFTLASISLVGQIYQLGSPTYQALLIWSACTLPFMTLIRGRLLGLIWLAGLIWTHTEVVIAQLERLDAQHLNHAFLADLAISIVFVSVLVYLTVARLPWLVRERAQLSHVWTNALWAAIVSAGLAVCFVFYNRLDQADTLSWGVAVAVAVGLILYAAWPRLYPHAKASARIGMAGILGLICSVLVVGLCFPHQERPSVGAIFQVLLLATSAWTVLQLGHLGLFNALTAAIAVRVLVIYFEVFGSLLDTGMGMISGGVLTLLLAWLWKRKSPQLAARLAEQEGGSHGA